MAYVVGFVAAVPAANREKFIEHAAEAAGFFKEHGATRVVEAWGDDVPAGQTTDFAKAVKLEEGEVVVFSWVEFPSKELRDAAEKKMMDDPRMGTMGMPFDAKRMIYGGFEIVVQA